MNLKKIAISTVALTSICFADIIWLEEAPIRMRWQEAMDYCKKLDAQLPTRKDFKKVWLQNNKASDIKGFELSVSFWTRDEMKSNKHAAYPFYFGDGRDTWYYKADKYGVKCVKDN